MNSDGATQASLGQARSQDDAAQASTGQRAHARVEQARTPARAMRQLSMEHAQYCDRREQCEKIQLQCQEHPEAPNALRDQFLHHD